LLREKGGAIRYEERGEVLLGRGKVEEGIEKLGAAGFVEGLRETAQGEVGGVASTGFIGKGEEDVDETGRVGFVAEKGIAYGGEG
jgi:hypothetical protein